MAFVNADRVREQASFAGGTGAVTLTTTPVNGFQSFLSGWGASGSGWVTLVMGSQWEVCEGSINAGGTTLTRGATISSSTGSQINFVAGTLDCFSTIPGSKLGLVADGAEALPTHSFFNDRDTGMYSLSANALAWSTGATGRLRLDSTALAPFTSDLIPLGTGSLMWADLFLASGGVVNWNNGNTTLTHSAGLLTTNAAFKTTITTAATSSTTGSGIFAGGVGVAGAVYAGNSFRCDANATGFWLKSSGGTSTRGLYMDSSNVVFVGSLDAAATSVNIIGSGTFATFASGATGVTFSGYGAGTLSTNASGVISASDGRLKEIIGPFVGGIDELMAMDDPVHFKWLSERKTNPAERYIGWTAQGVARGLPDAVKAAPDGILNYEDRAIMAALRNAVIAQYKRIEQLESKIH